MPRVDTRYSEVIGRCGLMVGNLCILQFDKIKARRNIYLKAVDEFKKSLEDVGYSFAVKDFFDPHIAVDYSYVKQPGGEPVVRDIPRIGKPTVQLNYIGDTMTLYSDGDLEDVPRIGQFIYQTFSPLEHASDFFKALEAAVIFASTPNLGDTTPPPDVKNERYGYMLERTLDITVNKSFPSLNDKLIVVSLNIGIRIADNLSRRSVMYEKTVTYNGGIVTFRCEILYPELKYKKVDVFYDPNSGLPVYIDTPSDATCLAVLVLCTYEGTLPENTYINFYGCRLRLPSATLFVTLTGAPEPVDVTEYIPWGE